MSHNKGLAIMIKHFRSLIMWGVVVFAIPSCASAQSCAAGPLTVQILGSGGPAINPERASASYLLWVGGQAKLLVDMGGGAYLRFGQSRAKTSDLALVAISHLHPDHISDLPAFLWLSNQVRTEPLPIVGPSAGKGVAGPAGNDVAPDFPTFLSRLFDEKTGAFQVLGGTLGGRGNFDIEPKNPPDDMIGPDLVGWVEVAGFGCRFEGSDDDSGRIRAQK
jgi:hypothetical protein